MSTETSASARVACDKKVVPRTQAKDDPGQKSSKDEVPAPRLDEARDFLDGSGHNHHRSFYALRHHPERLLDMAFSRLH